MANLVTLSRLLLLLLVVWLFYQPRVAVVVRELLSDHLHLRLRWARRLHRAQAQRDEPVRRVVRHRRRSHRRAHAVDRRGGHRSRADLGTARLHHSRRDRRHDSVEQRRRGRRGAVRADALAARQVHRRRQVRADSVRRRQGLGIRRPRAAAAVPRAPARALGPMSAGC